MEPLPTTYFAERWGSTEPLFKSTVLHSWVHTAVRSTAHHDTSCTAVVQCLWG